MLLATALWPVLQDVLNLRWSVYCSKQTGSGSTRNHHPSFLRFWNWAKKTVDAAKFVAAQKMLLKQKPSKHS